MSKFFTFLLVLLTLAAGYGQAAIADTAVVETVVVTAAKLPLPARETAKPVLIIPRATVDRYVGRDLAQLLDEQVGLTINGANSNPGLNKGVFLRGAGGAYTLLLVDGQPVNDPSGPGGFFDLRLIPLELIERVEVLRGSQSTLYGTDAVAGVINIITRRASTAQPLAAEARLAYGSNATLRAAAGLYGKTGALDYRVDYQRNQSKGISEALPPADYAGPDFDRDGFAQNGLQATLGLRALGDRLYLSPYLRMADFDGDTDADAFTDAANAYRARWTTPGLTARWEGAEFSARADYSYTQATRSFVTDFGDFNYEGQLHNADLLLGYRLGQFWQVLGGFQYQQHGMVDAAAVPADPTIRIASPYLTVLLRNWRGLSLEAGYRYNDHSTFGQFQALSLAPAYQLSPAWRVFASYTTGFKAPTLSELYGPFGGNPGLLPQTSASWEAGLQWQTPQRRLGGSLSYYQRTIEQVINYAFTPGFFNQDQQADHGLEAELFVEPAAGWRLAVQYAYLNGEVTTRNTLEQDTSFFNLYRRPRHRLNASVQWQASPRLGFSLQGQYTGERTDLFFNPANFYAAEEVGLDAYFLLHLYADYALAPGVLNLFVDGRNLTNAALTEVYGYNAPGTTLMVGVRLRPGGGAGRKATSGPGRS